MLNMQKEKESSGIRPSVVYRNGDLTPADYDEAIRLLQDARSQIEPNGYFCAVCSDSGHQAWECHHNPLVMARRAVQKQCTWRCFHCGEAFFDYASAEEHFGKKDDGPCACIASTHFLVVRLRARIQELMGQLIMGLTAEERAQLMSRYADPEAVGRRRHPDLEEKDFMVWSPELRARIRRTLAQGEKLKAMVRRLLPGRHD
jgi:hypothetical protein